MVDLNDHKCMFEYTDEELLGQGKLDIQARSHVIRDDRTFSEQYIVLKEIGKRWIREHENMETDDLMGNQYKEWNDEMLEKFYRQRKEKYNGAFPACWMRLLVEIADRWVMEHNQISRINRR